MFDRNGDLWAVGVTPGDIYKITPDRHCAVMAHTPNPVGLRMHKDGRIFGVDTRLGLFTIDGKTGQITPITNSANRANFHGLDDLYFDSTGGLYMTDAYGSSALNPDGQVFYRAPDGNITAVIRSHLAFPNGIVLSPDEKTLYVDDYDTNRIIAVNVVSPGVIDIDSAYVFAYLNGGHGPDSMTEDADGNLYVAHSRAAEVLVFNPAGYLFGAIRLPEGAGTSASNVAFHAGYLYITEMQQHTIWRVKTKIPGVKQFGDQ